MKGFMVCYSTAHVFTLNGTSHINIKLFLSINS
jgi:hypothetical protein